MMRRSSRWIAGFALGFLIVTASNHAAIGQSKTKWETSRVTEPEDPEELKALQDRAEASWINARQPRLGSDRF